MTRKQRVSQIINRFNYLYDIGEFRCVDASYLRHSHLMNMQKAERNKAIIDFYMSKISRVLIDSILKSAIAQIKDVQKLADVKPEVMKYIVPTIQQNLRDMGEWDQAVKVEQYPELHIFAILENI